MHTNPAFTDLVEKKYEEAKKSNLAEIVIDENTLGGLTLYINEVPEGFIASYEIDDDKLYVGGSLPKRPLN